VAGRSAYLLAEGLALQADGVVGELYIGGEALARGYHAQPSLTAERFVPDPFASTPARGCTAAATWSGACRTGRWNTSAGSTIR
jgi:non-ribosomal peptide synthetase component F